MPTLLLLIAITMRIVSNPLGNVFQKQLITFGKHPLLINFLSYFILAILCIPMMIGVDWSSLSFQFWFYSILAGIFGALGNGFLVKAMEKGDLSVLGPINSYKSIVGVITGIFLLREIPNVWGLAGMVLIIYGSYFVLDTTEDKFSWKLFRRPEIQFRIWALILTAIEAVFVKNIIIYSSVTIACLSWCVFGSFFSYWLMLYYKVDWVGQLQKASLKAFMKMLYLVGCVGTMLISTIYTFEHMPVGYALALFQLSTIISVLLGHRLFNEKDIAKKMIGSLIMILGSVLIILLKD